MHNLVRHSHTYSKWPWQQQRSAEQHSTGPGTEGTGGGVETQISLA